MAMLSEIQERKFKHLFNVIDWDGNGVLEKSDYLQIADNYVKVLELPEDSPGAATLRQSFAADWETLQERSADARGDGKVTYAEWRSILEQIVSTPELYELNIPPFVDLLFSIFDRDADGRLTYDEIARAYRAFRLPDGGQYAKIFERIDPASKGYLTREEFHRIADEFYRSGDENAPGGWFYGPF